MHQNFENLKPTMIEYNTKRNKLIIKEYGRNVQKMVEEALAIQDRNKRNEMAKAIVRVMAQLNEVRDPAQQKKEKESLDYWHKLWDHLFIMSDYALDVDCPFPKPTQEVKNKIVQKPAYNKNRITFRTYGRNMENIIKTTASYPSGPREEMSKILANHLKMMYLAYNRDSVDDKLIIKQLSELSNNQLSLPEDFTLISTHDMLHAASNAPSSVAPAKNSSGKKKKKKKKKKKSNISE